MQDMGDFANACTSHFTSLFIASEKDSYYQTHTIILYVALVYISVAYSPERLVAYIFGLSDHRKHLKISISQTVGFYNPSFICIQGPGQFAG
jgi:hypothetical protein